MKLSVLSVVDHYPELSRGVGQFYHELMIEEMLPRVEAALKG
jgi:hypothetical protein